ncbi:PulJ/GspJ family protein [Streptomyces sp. NBC_00370]|uniref:PulJ/GspJ family protein n=1 Tax=Streptomyces sp. NBC_00370 TaxID=2975728 RepID=UPI002E26C1C4
MACVLLAALALLAGGSTASAAGGDDGGTQSARLAELLRHNPVYVSDQLPREVPRSTAPAYAKLAKRTGVPTYVLVLPDASSGRSLLGAVHDRLGKDGLYVLVGTTGVTDARAFGVRAPAADAATVALYALPYDAGALRSFQEFVGAVAQGPERAAQRADSLRDAHAGDGKAEVEDLYIDRTDRENQSFLTGMLLLGVPLLVLLTGPYVRRWRHRRTQGTDGKGVSRAKAVSGGPRAAPKGLSLTKAASGAKGHSLTKGVSRAPRARPNIIELVVAGVLAALIGFGAPQVFDQTIDSATVTPTRADLTARLDRVAAGLRQDPVYTDLESPQLLDPASRKRLEAEIKAFTPGLVYVAVVPQLTDDESGGDAYAFAAALHRRLGKDGAYVVADPLNGDIDLVNYGLPLDPDRLGYQLPDDIRHEDFDHPADDHRLAQRLDKLMTFLGGIPRSDASDTDTLGSGTDATPDPLYDNALPALYTGDFWPGLMIGAFGAALLFGLITSGLGIARLVEVRRRERGTASPGKPTTAFDAPAAPSLAYLRRTAQRELTTLGTEFAVESADAAVQAQVWDCFDAAMLLTDGDPDGFVDKDVPAADLAAAIALARTALAMLRTQQTYAHCCERNPMHGPAGRGGPAARGAAARGGSAARGGRRRTPRPWLCEACRTAAGGVEPPGLTLPKGGGRIPYAQASGALPAARDGIPQLIVKVREYASVQ